MPQRPLFLQSAKLAQTSSGEVSAPSSSPLQPTDCAPQLWAMPPEPHMLNIQEYIAICYSEISDRRQEEAWSLGKLWEAKDASFPALKDFLND